MHITAKHNNSEFSHIGDNEFYRYSLLQNITIQSTVTTNGKRAFVQCSELETATMRRHESNW